MSQRPVTKRPESSSAAAPKTTSSASAPPASSPPPPTTTKPAKSKKVASDDDDGTPKSVSLPPAQDVFGRLFHDPSFNAADFDLGYEDRFKGVLFMPISKFRHTGDETSEIPFHRVQYFRFRGKVIWDRANKTHSLDALKDELDAASGSGVIPLPTFAGVFDAPLGVTAAEAPAAAVSATSSSSSRAKVERAATAAAAAAPSTEGEALGDDGAPTAGAASPTKTLRVVSYNILHDLFDADLIYSSERLAAIERLLETSDADVVCLQEVTPATWDRLRHRKALRQMYHWTQMPPGLRTGQAILSRLPIHEAATIALSKSKKAVGALIVVDPTAGAAGIVAVCNVHLISDYGAGDSATRRVNELHRVFRALQSMPSAIVTGDFNFGDQNPEATLIQWGAYRDAWLETRRLPRDFLRLAPPHAEAAAAAAAGPSDDATGYSEDQLGFTFDLRHNPLADMMSKHHRYPRRLDRMLVRGAAFLLAKDMSLFAQRSIGQEPGSGRPMFASDHFGLNAVFSFDASKAAQAAAASESSAAAATPDGEEGTATASDGHHLHGDLLPLTVPYVCNGLTPAFYCALCVIPPPALWPRINRIREVYDKAFPRWMPHINLLFPFAAFASYDAALRAVQVALEANAHLTTFSVKLNKINYFNAKKPVMFLDPEVDDDAGGKVLPSLQALMQRVFPDCGRKEGDGSYHPHLTLGQAQRDKLISTVAALQAEWAPVSFEVTEVHMIAHLTGTEGHEIIHSIHLAPRPRRIGGGASPAAAAAAAPAAAATMPASSDMILEKLLKGGKTLEAYEPQDHLERWLFTHSSREASLVRAAPTHISQKGGMYHVDSDLYEGYLTAWERAFKDCQSTAMWVEEMRGDIFKLYLDIDLRLVAGVTKPFSRGTALCQRIVRGVQEVLSGATWRQGGPAAAVPVVSTNLRSVVCACHGVIPPVQAMDPVTGATKTLAKSYYKSGFRMFFPRVVVDKRGYGKLVSSLAAWFAANVDRSEFAEIDFTAGKDDSNEGATAAAASSAGPWDHVFDVAGSDWERIRLLGTRKRRRDLGRIYGLAAALDGNGDPDEEATRRYAARPRDLLRDTTVALWNQTSVVAAAPSDWTILLSQ